MSPNTTSDKLFFVEFNNSSSKTPTIVFLHGLCSSHLEFTHVIPHLEQTYHILVIDLPKHSRSPSDEPFTLTSSSSRIASLIRTHAHNGQAHIVGLSLGGFIALKLLEEHPDLIQSVWITGASPFTGFYKWAAKRPTMVYYLNKTLQCLPAWLYNFICSWQGPRRHDELRQEAVSNCTFLLIRDAYSSILEFSEDNLIKIGATGKRILAIAGGLHDDVESTRHMSRILKQNGSQSKAVVVKRAVHAWDLQFPDLFAQGIKAWIEEDTLPDEYESLD